MATVVRMPEVLDRRDRGGDRDLARRGGPTVAVGQPLAEIETEKAVVEYAAEVAGTVLGLLAAEGAGVAVGDPIAVVGDAGEVAGRPADGSRAPLTGDEPASPQTGDEPPVPAAPRHRLPSSPPYRRRRRCRSPAPPPRPSAASSARSCAASPANAAST